MSEAKIDTTGAAENMRKYRKKNQLKNQKTTLIYLFHDSEKLNWKYILGLCVSRIIE